MATIFFGPNITRLIQGIGLADRYIGMSHVRGIQPHRVTTLFGMCMIERRDTPHVVQYTVVHENDSES